MGGGAVAEDKNAWVGRVLKFSLPPKSSGGGRIDPLVTWREAKDSVDEHLNDLAAELREFDDPDLTRIADLGLFSIGKGESVALMKGLMEYRTGGPAKADGLRKAVAAYRAVLSGSPLVKLIDDNPFGVSVSLAATLGGALDQIERALS